MNAVRDLVAVLSPRFRGAALSAIGLHITGDRISAAQMEHAPGGVNLHAIGSFELAGPWYGTLREPRQLKQVLKRLWSEQAFSGREVVAAMPQEQLKVFVVDYTPAQGQSDAQAIAAELKDRLKDKARTMVVDFVPVRQATQEERSRQAVVAAAAREDVTRFLDLLDGAGLNVRALDIASMALKRLVAWSDKGADRDGQNALLVDIGPTSTELMVISGRRLMLERAVEFGEQRLVGRVARLLELPEPTARRLLSDHALRHGETSAPNELDGALREILGTELMVLKTEVAKTLDYAASKTRGNGVEKIFLVGAAAGFAGIAQLLSSAFAKPVALLDPLAVFSHRLSVEQAAALSCGAAVAIGLALRGVAEP